MSGSTAKIVPEINLDEFERRLRSAGATQSGAEDPLAELTRLVNMISRENRGDGAAEPPQAHTPKAESFAPAANDEPGARFESGSSQAPYGESNREPPQAPPGFDSAPPPPVIAESHDVSEEEHAALLAGAWEAAVREGRPRSWYFRTVGLAAIGVVLLGGAAALKIGVVPGLPKRPPFIAAAEGTKTVQNYHYQIKSKVGARTDAHLVWLAIGAGLVNDDRPDGYSTGSTAVISMPKPDSPT